ncbi:MAG: helix-turn-helix transcriptional regulator [Hyphomicrobiales bacterium]
MASSDAKLSRVLEPLYCGNGHPRQWINLLGDMCDYVGGEVGQLVIGNHTRSVWNDEWFYALTPNRPISMLKSFFEAYGKADPRRRILFYNEGATLLDNEIEPPGFDRSGIVADFLDPLGMRRQICGVFAKTDKSVGTLSIMRSRRAGPFRAESRRRFGIVMSHLRQSYRLYDTVGRAAIHSSVSAMVDLLEVPIFVCTSDRRVLLANKMALDLVGSGEILLRAGALSATDLATEASLCAATDTAAKGAMGEGIADAPRICVMRGRRTGVLHRFRACPLAQKHPLRGEAGSRGVVALIGISRRSDGIRSVPVFVEVFGLRKAEATLAGLLMDGTSLDEAARIMRVTINTARSYLQLIFERTGSHRQAELVSILRSVVSIPLF